MEALLVSTVVVAIAEIGDKTQLLALLLVARHRAPWPIAFGILVATLANHALAGAVGSWLVQTMDAAVMRWILGGAFLLMAAWAMMPDSAPDSTHTASRFGVFVTTTIAFFLVEMGDKTQIATVALAAQFGAMFWVVMGTTAGMLLANVPVVLAGERILTRVRLDVVRRIAAGGFAVLGIYALLA